MVTGWLLPLLSLFILSRMWILPKAHLLPENWHGHEFYFAFFWSFLVGHLLTVSSSWSKNKNPGLLFILFFIICFLIDRLLILYVQHWANALLLIPFLIYMIYRFRKSWLNLALVSLILMVTLIAKAIFFIDGYEVYAKQLMSGVIRFYIVLIIGRMWGVYARQSFPQIEFLSPVWLHYATIAISFLLLLPLNLQDHLQLRMPLLIIGIFIYSLRFGFFKPQLTYKKPEMALFLMSFLWMIYGLILELQVFFEPQIFYFISFNHALYLGSLSLFSMAMIIRFFKGMTGEEIDERYLWLILIMVMGSVVFRILVPMYEGLYNAHIYRLVSALLWSGAWSILIKACLIKFFKRVMV